jgi:MYXO-CTERM domain-containing protein
VTDSPAWVPVVILFGLLLLAYLAMWRGWRRRSRKHDLPPLVAAPEEPQSVSMRATGRYFGTTTNSSWLDRVVARGLGTRSPCELVLSEGGLDVLRPTGSFRVPATAVRGARRDQGIAGKVVPPHGVLVVTWQHGDLTLDSGFRLEPADHDRWVDSLERLASEHPA